MTTMTLDAEEGVGSSRPTGAGISGPATDRNWLDVRLRVHVGAWQKLLDLLELLRWLKAGVELVDAE
jgi:hypothetical protein